MSLSTTDDPAIPAEITRRRRWMLLICAVVLCAIGVFAARPAYRWGRAWRGQALAAKAERLMQEEKWHLAAEKARAAYQLAPGDPAVLRTFARLYSRSGVAAGFDFWDKLLSFPQATSGDRREAVRFALQASRLDFAAEHLGVLLKDFPDDSETLEFAAQLAMQQGDRPAALDSVNRLISRHPAHPSAPLLRAQLLFSAPDPTQQTEGKHQLQQFAQGDTAASLTALRTLANGRSFSTEESRSLSAAIAAHPKATIQDQLTSVSLQIRGLPGQRTSLIEQAIQQFSFAGPDSLAALGRWANQLGEYERVIDFIPAAAALSRQDLFLVRLDALAALARWSEIQRILKEEKTPLEDAYREVFLARAARELGEPRGAEARWANALRAAGESPKALLFVGQYAEKLKAYEAAEEAYRQLARQPAWTERANRALIPLLEAQGKTSTLRDIIKQIARLNPKDPAPRNDAAYLDLLLNENVPAARQFGEQLVREHPEMMAFRTTLALAHLRSGDPAAAARLYEGINVSWDQTPPGWQAIHAAVLAANGETEKARAIAGALPRERLKPEESTLVEALK